MMFIKCSLMATLLVAGYTCLSIPQDKVHPLIIDKCFGQNFDRRPLPLGQQFPVGVSIENLISLIERIEAKMPQMNAQQIIILLLRRFHIDGLHQTGVINVQSQIEMKHKRITEEVMTSSAGNSVGANIDFPEDILTDDEKCALFYTISHTINDTARHDDEKQYTYQRQIHLSRAPTKPNNRTVLPIPRKVNTSQPTQSEFLPLAGQPKTPAPPQQRLVVQQNPLDSKPKQLVKPKETVVSVKPKEDEEDEEEEKKRRRKRQVTNKPKSPNVIAVPISNIGPNVMTVTRRPRERGVASFRNDHSVAISVNRVLMGTAVGLLTPTPRTVRELIKSIAVINTDGIPDGTIDPLLAVTLSDLLGIDAGSGLTRPIGDVLFGATGHWNSTACQTVYRLTSNGTLATLAELRGGLDGYNIGKALIDRQLFINNPRLTVSQILRQYYSNTGLAPDTSVCKREKGVVGDLQNKLQNEANNYIRVWNAIFYENTYEDNQLTGFVAETWQSFYQFLNKAVDKPSEEREYCSIYSGADIKTAPIETSADLFFLLDSMPAQGDGKKEEIEVVTKVVKSLNLGRFAGTASVFLNALGQPMANIVDENNQQLNPPLFSLAYNTTSSQCASCRAAWFDDSRVGMTLTDRPPLLEAINKTLMEFELKKSDCPGVSSKNFIWFEYGNLKDSPTDRDGKRKYEDFKWRLRYEHRDVTFFMATINKDNVLDLLRRDEDWIQMGQGVEGAKQAGLDLANKITQTPQQFQYNNCRQQASQDYVYEGYLTPGYKQYWAMYPEHFIKSFNVDLKFKAENAKIKVCFDRYPVAEREDRRCVDAKTDGDEIRFTANNPCKGKTFENCAPFYFTIALSSQANTDAQGGIDCKDPRCKSSNGVKWTFTHTGISCNGSTSLWPNWTFQIICFLVFLTLFHTNSKRNQYLE